MLRDVIFINISDGCVLPSMNRRMPSIGNRDNQAHFAKVGNRAAASVGIDDRFTAPRAAAG